MATESLSIYYSPEDRYIFNLLPAFVQSRYRNGHGYVQFQTYHDSLFRICRRWRDIVDENDELLVPITDRERQMLYDGWTEQEFREIEEAQIRAETQKEAERQRERERSYLQRYLFNSGLMQIAVQHKLDIRYLYDFSKYDYSQIPGRM